MTARISKDELDGPEDGPAPAHAPDPTAFSAECEAACSSDGSADCEDAIAPDRAQASCGAAPRDSETGAAQGVSEADPSDEALIERIAARRDRAAFGLLFERYGARIKGYMMRAGAGADLAEEAAQEALLAVWRRAETFDPRKASAPAWIFAIARNKRIDLLRRARRREVEPEDPSAAPEPPAAADAILSAAARDGEVRRALTALSQDQRTVVLLAFYEGCSHSEIAERLALPLGTVKSRLRLAFGALRSELGLDFRDELLDF